MSDKLKLDKAIDEAVKDATNAATVEVDTEKVEAAVTHTAASWSVAGYVRKFFGKRGVEAGARAEKRW